MTSFSHSALVVEGGAMRSVFSAGLLDGFLARNFNPFHFYIGVSAGATNLVAYIAGEPECSLRIFRDIGVRSEFISYRRFLLGGHLIDLDWLAQIVVSNSYLDLSAIDRHTKPLYVGVTEVATGLPLYIEARRDNLALLLKASAALPMFYRNFPEIDGRPMADGGIADGIPVTCAIRMGARRIMVVRSRHAHYQKRDTPMHRYVRWRMRKYPALKSAMEHRVGQFANSMALIHHPPNGVRMLEICPPPEITLSRFARNHRQLDQAYAAGLVAADSAIEQWHVCLDHTM